MKLENGTYTISTYLLLEGEFTEYRREHPTAVPLYFCENFCDRGPVWVEAGSRTSAVIQMYRSMRDSGRL